MKEVVSEIIKQILRDVEIVSPIETDTQRTSTSIRIYEDLVAYILVELHSNNIAAVNFAVNFMKSQYWSLADPNFIDEARQWINEKAKELADKAPKLKADGHKWSIGDRSRIYYNTYQKCIGCNKEIFWLDPPSDAYTDSTREWKGNPDDACEIENGRIVAGFGSKHDTDIIEVKDVKDGFVCDSCLDKMIKNGKAKVVDNYWKDL